MEKNKELRIEKLIKILWDYDGNHEQWPVQGIDETVNLIEKLYE